MTDPQLYTIIALAVYAIAMALIGCISFGKSKTLDGFLIGKFYAIKDTAAIKRGTVISLMEMEDITLGSFVTVTKNSKGEVTDVLVSSRSGFGGFGGMGGFGGEGSKPEENPGT